MLFYIRMQLLDGGLSAAADGRVSGGTTLRGWQPASCRSTLVTTYGRRHCCGICCGRIGKLRIDVKHAVIYGMVHTWSGTRMQLQSLRSMLTRLGMAAHGAAPSKHTVHMLRCNI